MRRALEALSLLLRYTKPILRRKKNYCFAVYYYIDLTVLAMKCVYLLIASICMSASQKWQWNDNAIILTKELKL